MCFILIFLGTFFNALTESLYYIASANTREIFDFHQKLTLIALLDQLFSLGLGQLGIVAGLHSVVATTLSLGTQVGCVAEHLGQRHVCVNLNSTGTGDLTQDVAATTATA